VAALAVLAVLLVAVAVALWLTAALEPYARRAEKLGVIDLYGYAGRAEAVAEAAKPGLLSSLAVLVGGFLVSRFRSLREAEVQRRLVAGGFYGLGARRFVGYRLLLTVALPAVLVFVFGLAGASAGVLVLLAAAGAALGWAAPGFYLARRTRARREQIDYEMPELIDLLVVILEAGIAFTGALRMASERLGGPLGDELRLTVQEQALGLSTMDALQHWLARCETPAVGSFVRAMLQGERLGVSVGQVLRNLAVEMRLRRRQAAEERAHKAGVKILFPLAFLIFPAMFVIMLAPAVYRIVHTLQSH
jgi:tight adherence protein C